MVAKILLTANNVYNALKLADWPEIAAPTRHVCRPQKPRTGRTSKAKKQAVGKPNDAS